MGKHNGHGVSSELTYDSRDIAKKFALVENEKYTSNRNLKDNERLNESIFRGI